MIQPAERGTANRQGEWVIWRNTKIYSSFYSAKGYRWIICGTRVNTIFASPYHLKFCAPLDLCHSSGTYIFLCPFFKKYLQPKFQTSLSFSWGKKKKQECTMKKRQSLKQVVLGKLDNYMQKNDIRTFSLTKYKSKLKMD